MILKEFLVQLGFKVNEAGLAKFNDGVTSASARVGLLAGAVSAASLAVFAGVNSMANKLDELADVAGRIGVTVEEIDKLGYAAALNDSSIDAMTQSLEGLARTAGLAANGLGRGAKVFDKLGINVKDSNGKLKNTADLMREVGEAIKPLEKGEQTALLSRLGIDKTLAATLTSDLSALFAEYERINQAAGFIPDEAAKEASQYEDALNKLKHVFGVISKTVASKFFKKFTDGFKKLTDELIVAMPKIIPVVTSVANVILMLMGAIFDVFRAIFRVITPVISAFLRINSAMGGLPAIILGVVAAWKLLNLGFLASPIGAVIALAAGIALLADDLLTFLRGGKSLINWGNPVASVLATVAAAVLGAAAAFGIFKAAMIAFNAVAGMNPLALAVKALVVGAALVIANWGTVKKWFSDFFGWFSDKFKTISGAIGSVFGGGAPALAPSPTSAASVGSAQGGNTVNAKTEIIVNGAGDPKAVGATVAGLQKSVNSDTVRNFAGAAR